MNEFKELVRTFIMVCAKVILHFFWIFPVSRKTVVFSCYKGTQYSCNPKYIYLDLKKRFGNKLNYVWILNSYFEDSDLKGVKIVKFMSLKYFFYICTCSVYINNIFFEPFIPKRNEQLFINTWHGGGAYKGNDDNRRTSPSMILKDKLRDSITDYYIASCQSFTDCWSREFKFNENKFLSIGLPRNDIFFVDDINIVKKKAEIKDLLGIKKNQKIILFAPTWRFKERESAKAFTLDFNVDKLLFYVENRFSGNFVFLFRGHHCMKDIFFQKKSSKNFFDVSNYPDMQELLLITDVFISDYSSCIWDFALTGKPGLLYTPDLIEYTATQHLLTPIETWQYDYACSFEELLLKIKNFDNDVASEKIRIHFNNFGSHESGRACEFIRSLIEKHQGGIL